LDQDLAAGIGWTRGAAAPVAGTGVLRRRVAGVTRKRVLGHGLGSGGTHETRANYSRVQGGLQRVERGLLRRGGTAAQQHMTASKINAAQREERRGNRLRELPHQHDMLQGRAGVGDRRYSVKFVVARRLGVFPARKFPVQRGVEGGRCARCRTSPPHEAPAVRRGRRGASRRRVRDGAVAALCSEHNAAVAARVEVAAVGLGSRSGRGVVKRGRLGSRRVGPRRGARRRSRRDGRAKARGGGGADVWGRGVRLREKKEGAGTGLDAGRASRGAGCSGAGPSGTLREGALGWLRRCALGRTGRSRGGLGQRRRGRAGPKWARGKGEGDPGRAGPGLGCCWVGFWL